MSNTTCKTARVLRRIHPFGPLVGKYVDGANTDICETFRRERARLGDNSRPPFESEKLCLSLDGAVFG